MLQLKYSASYLSSIVGEAGKVDIEIERLFRQSDSFNYQRKVPFTVLALDIDHFKQVNDQYGHTQGDALLKQVAELIKREVRLQDMTCRSGGEEFIVFLSGVDVDRARIIAEQIRLAVESHSFAGLGQITISIGIAHWQSQQVAVGKIIKDADDALYRAKRNGRNRVEVFC